MAPAANNTFTKRHGYIFEIPAANYGETTPVALTAMGRFEHEAVAVDPATSIIYETEDGNPSGFYRFLPSQPGSVGQPANLAAGGTLQMLAVANQPRLRHANGRDTGSAPGAQSGSPSTSQIRKRDSHHVSIRESRKVEQGSHGWKVRGTVTVVSSSSQPAAATPALVRFGSTRLPAADTGILKLVYESTSSAILEAPDNLHFTPRGGILLCEDGGGLNFLRGLTPAGVVFDFVGHNASNSEVAGATFSRDGQTLFFNYQGTGETFAVWPRDGHSWEEGAL